MRSTLLGKGEIDPRHRKLCKWRARQAETTTVQDVIDKVASVSSTIGQSYRIRFTGGHEIRSGASLRRDALHTPV